MTWNLKDTAEGINGPNTAPGGTYPSDVGGPGTASDAAGFASWHPGGCNFLLADGSVHFVSQDIAQSTLAGNDAHRAVAQQYRNYPSKVFSPEVACFGSPVAIRDREMFAPGLKVRRNEFDRRIGISCLSQAKGRTYLARRRVRVGWGFCLSIAFTTISLSGCNEEGLQRSVVTGSVTYKGEPVSDGTIVFTPAASSHVPSAGASIIDGSYTVDSRGGVPVGTHRICIEAFHRVPFTLRPGEPAPRNYFEGKAREQYLPKKYNSDSELEITIEPGSQQITKNFELTE